MIAPGVRVTLPYYGHGSGKQDDIAMMQGYEIEYRVNANQCNNLPFPLHLDPLDDILPRGTHHISRTPPLQRHS